MRLIKLGLLLLTVAVVQSCRVSVGPSRLWSATIVIDSIHVLTGEVVSFRATIEGGVPPYEYEWISSTGNRGSKSLYQETFDFSGSYSIRLIVHDHQDQAVSDRVTIFVERDDSGDNENENGNENGNDNNDGDNENDNEDEEPPPPPEPPTVDLKVNGSDGEVTVTEDDQFTLSWQSEHAEFVEAFGDWSGARPFTGVSHQGPLTEGRYVFSLVAFANGESAMDSVVVNVIEEDDDNENENENDNDGGGNENENENDNGNGNGNDNDEPPDFTAEIISPANGSIHCCVGDPITFVVAVDDEFDGPFNFHWLFPDGDVIVISDGHLFSYDHTFPFEIQNGIVAVQVTDIGAGRLSNKDWITISVLP